MSTENKKQRIYTGSVVSDKMEKTVVVAVERVFRHPVFGKVIKRKSTYKVHDSNEVANVGDVIEFYQGRPVSKTKFMYLSRVVKNALGDEKVLNGEAL